MAEEYDRQAAEDQVRDALVWILSDDATDRWLDAPAAIFEGATARELLDAGPQGRDRVLAAIDALASGAFL